MPKRKSDVSVTRNRAPAGPQAEPVITAEPAVAGLPDDEANAFASLRYLAEDETGLGLKLVEVWLTFPPGDWAAIEEAAMSWTYVLRSRQRWVSSIAASDEHVERATEQLQSFGVSPSAIQQLARATHIEVRMSASAHDDGGWSVRIFPWEYVIASATRPYRHGDPITVTRTLDVYREIVIPDDARARPTSVPELRVLYVESAPGEIGKFFNFRGERELIDIYLSVGLRNLKRLYAPTPKALSEAIAAHRPHIVHLSGMDSHEAAIRLHWLANEMRTVAPGTKPSVAPDPGVSDQGDGFVLTDSHGQPQSVGPRALAEALTAGRTWFPWLVCMNIENAGSRLAARAVQWGCHAAVGFQDAFDSALAELFFGTLYASLGKGWDLSLAFREAWNSVRDRPGSLVGTGVLLWTDAPELHPPQPKPALDVAAASAASQGCIDPDKVEIDWIRSRVSIKVKPKGSINYSLLHNDDVLFEEFSIKPHPGTIALDVGVRVTLCAGIESADYACSIDLKGRPVDLRQQIRVSLSANLIRSVHEAISTTWLVEVTWGRHVLLRETYPVRLLPTDQWRDAASGRSWLPSFVFPRDRAVCELVAKAANYVRVLRDDPSAGFEGYQCLPNNPEPRDALDVDLQVQALWSTILYEWRLTYINPPPSYSSELDSQRLRTPSMIARDRHGTCIDLALLLAACLELVDIWPVIFLLDNHAFPGYWRAHAFHDRFRSARPEEGAMQEIMEAGAEGNSVGGAQRYPWAVGRAMSKEVMREVRSGRLVPLETVRLTENCGFAEAVEAGKENFRDPNRFEYLIDVAIARQHGITPLPLLGDPS